MKICSVQDCGARVLARGFCARCYQRDRYRRDPAARACHQAASRRTRETKGKEIDAKKTARYRSDPEYRRKLLDQMAAARKRRGARTNQARKEAGFTAELFEALWDAQAGRCALCSLRLVDKGRSHNSCHADHDHSSGRPRGLLCRSCNLSLGFYENHQKPAGLELKPYDDYLRCPPTSAFVGSSAGPCLESSGSEARTDDT